MLSELTAKQLRALAREARKLASEYAEGQGPALLAFSWCGCAAAELLKRAGLGVDGSARQSEKLHMMAFHLDHGLTPSFTLSRATDWQFVERVPGALVVPLMWAADELEIAAKAAPKALP